MFSILAPRQPYWSAHVDQHNVAWYAVSALLYLSDAGVEVPGQPVPWTLEAILRQVDRLFTPA